MIARFEALIRKTRRFFSRSEWAVRLLGLPRLSEIGAQPGLVLIQLDGLSETQARLALEHGRMPFLKHLLEDEGFSFVPYYCGLPSTTPAVQGELFYGVKQVVPAFSFLERKTGRIIRMYEHDPSADIENRLGEHDGLLEGGSAYTNIYTGGAENTRFCASSGVVTDLARTRYPWAVPFLVVTNIYSIVRTITLFALEIVLSVGGVFRGVVKGQNLWSELKFVPSRVFVCILLRELVTIGAKVDIARGLPVVSVNFLSYDEQAHRRGPSSRFAHWGLKGMDDAIARLVRAAHRSIGRSYDIWVYSDHGQEDTDPYPEKYGRTVQEAVAEVFEELDIKAQEDLEPKHGVQLQRARMFGESIARKLLAGADVGGEWLEPGHLFVAAMGPLGHVYSPRALAEDERAKVAERLVSEAHVPLVLAAHGPAGAAAWTRDGKFHLPEDAGKLLGDDHPYLDAVRDDLIRLCHHENAGDFVLSGWQLEGKPISFPEENGAHAGPGPHETSAFVVLPRDIKLPHHDGAPLRPVDLRAVALDFLGRRTVEIPETPQPLESAQEVLRIMTYNVHSCIGMDGKLSPKRIARVIDFYQPDVVALQELDMGRSKTGGVDQAHLIAQELQMVFHFHPLVQVEEEKYGDAVLSRHPMKVIRAAQFPGLNGRGGGLALEPRGAIWVEVRVNGRLFHLVNTHLSLHPRERRIQAEALVGPEWLSHPDFTGTRILCGDFNAGPNSPAYRQIAGRLRDAQEEHKDIEPKPTFFSRYPFTRIDHIFVDQNVEVLNVEIPSTRLTRVASDHLPLVVDIAIPRD